MENNVVVRKRRFLEEATKGPIPFFITLSNVR